MKIFSTFPTVNISKLNFWLVICIVKNLIWTTLKMIFSIFRFFCTLRFQIYKYCPIITNHTSMERLFFGFVFGWCINLNLKKLTLMTGFVLQGHILWIINNLQKLISTLLFIYSLLASSHLLISSLLIPSFLFSFNE